MCVGFVALPRPEELPRKLLTFGQHGMSPHEQAEATSEPGAGLGQSTARGRSTCRAHAAACRHEQEASRSRYSCNYMHSRWSSLTLN